MVVGDLIVGKKRDNRSGEGRVMEMNAITITTDCTSIRTQDMAQCLKTQATLPEDLD